MSDVLILTAPQISITQLAVFLLLQGWTQVIRGRGSALIII